MLLRGYKHLFPARQSVQSALGSYLRHIAARVAVFTAARQEGGRGKRNKERGRAEKDRSINTWGEVQSGQEGQTITHTHISCPAVTGKRRWALCSGARESGMWWLCSPQQSGETNVPIMATQRYHGHVNGHKLCQSIVGTKAPLTGRRCLGRPPLSLVIPTHSLWS